MSKKIQNEISKNKIYILILCITFLLIGSALSICINNFVFLEITALLFVIVVFIIRYKLIIPKKIFKKNKVPLFLIAVSLPSLIFNWSITGLSIWIMYYLAILYAYILSLFYSKQEIMYSFVKAIVYVSIFSLICYVLFIILKIPYNGLYKISKVTDSSISYYTLGFYNIWTLEPTRNCGPFWEPSIFAAYLSFALIVRLFLIENKTESKLDIYILIITIITTFSTGGYILLLLILIMAIFNNRKTNFYSGMLVIVGILAMILFQDSIKNILLDINYNVFSKIFEFNTKGTTQTRIVSFITNLQIWKNNPLFGVGLQNLDFNYERWKIIIGTEGLNAAQTSTSTLMFASFGLFGLYYNLKWIQASIKQDKLNLLQKLIFIIIIFFILNETPHTNFIITYFLLFIFLKEDVDTRQIIKSKKGVNYD